MKICISYADWRFRPAQLAHERTALRIGKFDKYIAYSPRDLARDFVRRNKHILGRRRGGGYWLWKPYVIYKTLATLKGDDLLMYADAGTFFLRSIDSGVDFLGHREDKGEEKGLISFESRGIEKLWTKRDVFVLMDCDTPRYTDTRQRLGGIHLWRRTPFTMKFLEEWLHYAQDERIITDIPNRCGKPNYDGFSDNRHDQSIFSLLTKKYDLPSLPQEHYIFDYRSYLKYTPAIPDLNDKPAAIIFLHGRSTLPSLNFFREYETMPTEFFPRCRYLLLSFYTDIREKAARFFSNLWRKLLRFIRRCGGARMRVFSRDVLP